MWNFLEDVTVKIFFSIAREFHYKEETLEKMVSEPSKKIFT